MAGLQPEFDKRHCKIIGLSVDPVGNPRAAWAKDIDENPGSCGELPDDRRPRAEGGQALRPAARRSREHFRGQGPLPTTPPWRAVFIIGPDKKIKAMLTYPMDQAGETLTRCSGCSTRSS